MVSSELDKKSLSPMMKQYFSIKEEYSDYILFFRLGDFYEMFFEDANIASKLLGLTLTGRDCGLEHRAPMCGVPHHSSEIYIKKLVELGQKVAICEQVVETSAITIEHKGLVGRQVTQIVTPGTRIESSMLCEEINNYMGSIFYKEDSCSVCLVDISTGAVKLLSYKGKNFQDEIVDDFEKYKPVELVFNQDVLELKKVLEHIKDKLHAIVQILDDSSFDFHQKKEIILKHFNAVSIEDLGLQSPKGMNDDSDVAAVCGLFDYISETQKQVVGRFSNIERYSRDKFMVLDLTARRNLELLETIRNNEKKGSLIWALDYTKTSMGKRLLRSYIEQPLFKPAAIIARLDAVERIYENSVVQIELSEVLGKIYDLERLMTRVVYKTATPKDLRALCSTANQIPRIKELLSLLNSELLSECNTNISDMQDVSNLIENVIVEFPPISIKDGGIIKDGFNPELDELRGIIANSENILNEIEQNERVKTGIKGLKIGYTRVFGYYIEVTKSGYSLIPDTYTRKQTLSNCERFVTDALKEQEIKILGASDKIKQLEMDIFIEVREFVATQLSKVQVTASSIAILDVINSFAYVSIKNSYVKPSISMDGVIHITQGRHPVVELMMMGSPYGMEPFVPNDTFIDTGDNKMFIITGPNMAGKSTYMRQVALITLMAQIGCFVPADNAKISIVDRIFTRIGASDDLASGQSTFMVEMKEVADILKNATKQSLIILDEVGRGTSTYDGISIAKSVAEYISNPKTIGCKTLFATHYHELIRLEYEIAGVKNYSVAVKKRGVNGELCFLRKIVPGGVDDSYGIEVAKLAGVPNKVINRAKEILLELEKKDILPASDMPNKTDQVTFFALASECIVDKLKKTNVVELSDSEAKYFLEELVKML